MCPPTRTNEDEPTRSAGHKGSAPRTPTRTRRGDRSRETRTKNPHPDQDEGTGHERSAPRTPDKTSGDRSRKKRTSEPPTRTSEGKRNETARKDGIPNDKASPPPTPGFSS
eukprot:2899245-Amphidinium_carterae.1